MSEPRLFIALKAFIEHEGKILILREAGEYADGTNAGKFDVPGGRLKPGEKFEDALRREVEEETGLTVTIGSAFHVGEWRPVVRGEEWQVVGVFMKCVAESAGVRLTGDHDRFEWIDPVTHRDHPLIENLHAAFEAYLR